MRIVGWNIRAGGGYRGLALGAQLRRFRPDVAVLCEFRATPPSGALALTLAELVSATRSPRPIRVCPVSTGSWSPRGSPSPGSRSTGPAEPGRWLLARVKATHPFALGAMHVPNRVTGRKWPFLDSVLSVAENWRDGPAVFVGDTNWDDRASTRNRRRSTGARARGSTASSGRAGAMRSGTFAAPRATTPGTHPMAATDSGSIRPS